MELENCVVYDVEIAKNVDDVPGKWDNPEGMGFASAVAYDYREKRYRFFLHEEQKHDLLELLQNQIAITFNGVSFDSRVTLGNKREAIVDRTPGEKLSGLMQITDKYRDIEGNYCCAHAWLDFDILLQYVRSRFEYDDVKQAEERLGDKAIHDGSFSLDGLAEGTFGMHKTGHGARAPMLYQENKYAELLEYNLQDVRLTKKLFEFIQEYGFVVDRAGRSVRFK